MVNLTLTELDPLTATQNKIRRADLLTPFQEAEAAINALPDLNMVELGSPAASIDLSSIPQTGQILDLFFRLRSAKAATNDDLRITINSDATAAHYLHFQWSQKVTSASMVDQYSDTGSIGYLESKVAMPAASVAAGYWANWHIRIFDYSFGESDRKNVMAWASVFTGATTADMYLKRVIGCWTSATTDPVSSVQVLAAGGNLIAGCRYGYRILGAT